MSRITQKGTVAPIALFNTSNDEQNGTYVGQRFDLSDGREVVLVQNAGTAITAGTLVQGPAIVANHQTLAVTAFTPYSANGNQPAQASITLGATSVSSNEYAGGFAVVSAGAGIGQTLKIASHKSALAGASVVITFEDAPVIALTVTSKVNLILNPFGSDKGATKDANGVIINPIVATGSVIGVTLYDIGASTASQASYGLVQTKGAVSCLNEGGTAVGLDVMASTVTAGAVETYAVNTTSGATTGNRVGVSTQVGVTATAGLITVQL